MRRSISIATLAALLLWLPAWGQMRGARGGGGRPMGVAHAPAMVAHPNGGGMRGHFGGGVGGGFGRPGAFGFHHHHHHHHHFLGAGFGYPWAYGYYPGLYGDYYPLDYDSADYDQSYSDQSYSQNQQLQSYQLQMMNYQQQIEQRMDALEERLDRFLAQRSAPPPQAQDQAKPAQSKSEPSRSAVLVYRDGHTQEVQNYAIVGQTLWVLNEQQAKKIPLSSLDRDATRKANEDRDVDFELPASSS